MTDQQLTDILDLVRLVAASPYRDGYRILVIVRRPDGTMHWADADISGDVNVPAMLIGHADEQARLRAKIERLQGLIKAAEWAASENLGGNGGSLCPWCDNGDGIGGSEQHAPTCPAFGETP